MDGNFNVIQQLLQERADYQARLNLIPYDGSPEVKENSSGRYLYIRKRVNAALVIAGVFAACCVGRFILVFLLVML